MDSKRPDELVARVEVFVTPDEGHVEVSYHWSGADHQHPPPDDTIQECFHHGVGARSALVQLAATAWGTPPANLVLSNPQLLKRPGGNYFEALVRWEMIGAVPSCWRGLQVVVSFRDPYMLSSLAPHRFDVFLTPWVTHPMASDEFDTSPEGLERVSERLEAMRGSLAELLAIMYQQDVAGVDLTIPRWEEDCVTYAGGDAFKVAGILRGSRAERADGLQPAFALVHVPLFCVPKDLFPEDVTYSINSTIAETVACYDNECYLASIGLCGRVIETLLSGAYRLAFSTDPDAEKLGFHAIRSRLRKGGILLDDATDSQLDVINAHRNKAVHGSVRIPTREEAQAVLIFTRDVLNRVVSAPNMIRQMAGTGKS